MIHNWFKIFPSLPIFFDDSQTIRSDLAIKLVFAFHTEYPERPFRLELSRSNSRLTGKHRRTFDSRQLITNDELVISRELFPSFKDLPIDGNASGKLSRSVAGSRGVG